MIDYNSFVNCRSEYRGAPFWSLNDRLEPDELVHQIHEMHKQGIGGFFMHARGGLMDEYLGERYLECIGVCIEEARKLGMKAWIYDEGWCPSGNAAGRITAENPEYASSAVVMVRTDSRNYEAGDNVVKVFISDDYTDVTGRAVEEIRGMNCELLVFKVLQGRPNPQFNNSPNTDLCRKDVVDRFIEMTHEKYRKKFGESFGDVVPGFFTDEPNFEPNVGSKSAYPWTPGLEEAFEKMKGYSIASNLPSLFLKTGNYKKVRFDYWDVMTRLFAEAFSKNIYDWCSRYGVKLTGHYWEHGFPSPKHTGSAMPNYEFMQYPGIDMLFNTEERRDQVGNDLIVKEASSAANQLGKERVLSETYGASGWDLTFLDQKLIGDWQLALGINYFCQHLSLYSLRGYRKRDFPLSFLYHQPWWDSYHLMGDYLGRMCYALSQGKYTADILVLHPFSSAWAEYDPDAGNEKSGEAAEKIERSVKNLLRQLSAMQFFYDLGDDILMERHAKVEGNCLKIGEMAYTTVILPEMYLLRSSSFELLKEFAGKGGRIIAAGAVPTLLDGEESRELVEFFNSNAVVREQAAEKLGELLKSFGNKCVRLSGTSESDTESIYCHKRIDGDKEILFLCNNSKQHLTNIRLELDEAFAIEEWDAVTGSRNEVPVYKDGNGYYLKLEFFPAGSYLFIRDTSKTMEAGKIIDISAQASQSVLTTGTEAGKNSENPSSIVELSNWQVERQELNALTLNLCRVAVGDGEWEPEDSANIWEDRLKDRLGLGRSNIFNRQPWMYSEDEKNKVLTVKARYTFRLDEAFKGKLFAAVESPDYFKVYVNGTEAEPMDAHYVDRAFILHDISAAVRPGENEVVLYTDRYGVMITLENIYIAGDFRLDRDDNGFIITAEKNGLTVGDWTKQGYPYYSGKMRYSTTFDLEKSDETTGKRRVEVNLGSFYGSSVRLIVNGQEAGILAWEPYTCDISSFVTEGSNQITVEVMNTLQNLLGPHDSKILKGIASPGSFYSKTADRFEKSGFDGKGEIRVFQQQ